MSTITKPKINIFNTLKELFKTGEDIENYDIEFDPEQKKASLNADNMMMESSNPIVSTKKTNKNGGLSKSIKSVNEIKIPSNMQRTYNEIKDKDKEIGD